MAQKRITDLFLRDNVSSELYFPSDDGIQSYRVSAEQILDFIKENISFPTTGDLKLTLKTTADIGWILCNDGTIGSGASGATTRANADCEDLYVLLWDNVSNTYAPVTGGRGSTAISDFNNNKPIALTKMLGRALAISGAGSGLTSRALGLNLGAETHVLDATEMPSHTHVQDAHSHTINLYNRTVYTTGGAGGAASNAVVGSEINSDNTTAINQNTGGGLAHNNMQPTSFVNVMIKL